MSDERLQLRHMVIMQSTRLYEDLGQSIQWGPAAEHPVGSSSRALLGSDGALTPEAESSEFWVTKE